VQIMQLWRSEISTPSIAIPQSIYAPRGPSRKEIQGVVKTIIFHRNIVTLGYCNEFCPSYDFSQFEFSRKNFLYLPVYCVEIFNYHPIIELPFRLWCEVDCPINRIRKSPPQCITLCLIFTGTLYSGD